MKKKYALMAVLGMFFLTSCSHRLVGTWNVSSYETSKPETHNITLNNIGTMKFKGNGKGENNISFEIMGKSQEDKLPFQWDATEDRVTITTKEDKSDFAKTWIIVENKAKYQKWKSTDGSNTVQIIELRK